MDGLRLVAERVEGNRIGRVRVPGGRACAADAIPGRRTEHERTTGLRGEGGVVKTRD